MQLWLIVNQLLIILTGSTPNYMLTNGIANKSRSVINTVIILSSHTNELKALRYQYFSLVIWDTLAFILKKWFTYILILNCITHPSRYKAHTRSTIALQPYANKECDKQVRTNWFAHTLH